MTYDKTINMYIFEGNPNGRIMCELSNWNGRVYRIARSELQMFGKREDCQNTGVYFLFGKDIDKGDTIYIGEAEKLYERLRQHLKDQDYWNECIAVLSKDNHLNKAHVKYMENQFYLIAKETDRYYIVNSTIPTCSSISEYDKAMLDEFVDHTKLLVNTLGKKPFEPIVENESTDLNVGNKFYIQAARGAHAVGIISSDGFVVLKGSKIAGTTTPSISPSLYRLREKLIDDGTIDAENAFVKDYAFTSPSLAAAVVMGRNANGKTEWKNEGRKSIADVEAME